MKPSQWLYELFTYLLALLFLFTSLNKILDMHHFVREMNNQVFPKPIPSLLIVLVPLVEIATAILLLRLKTRIKGLWLSFILMVAFSSYVGLVVLHIFTKVPCSCAGVFNHMTWLQHLAFNIGFTVIAAGCLLIAKRQERVGNKVPAL
jgi:uncharacterized membrane protein YphA (DoxX/SURF4 family)